jgi:N-dimethylarginine dimethylaminohydrolase
VVVPRAESRGAGAWLAADKAAGMLYSRAQRTGAKDRLPMSQAPRLLLVDPAQYDVSYVINPWMQPGAWAADPAGHKAEARRSFVALCAALRAAGAELEIIDGVAGQPDMVFPANAAVVLDGRAIVARFACAERRGEEQPYFEALQALVGRGVLREVAMFPEGCFQEGAGDAIWDASRQLFWAGYGQRSVFAATQELARFFPRRVVALELASDRFYHLDTCFCPLSGGEVLFHPPAFTAEALARIHDLVPEGLRLEAEAEDAAAFCVNAVNIGRDVVMAAATPHVRAMLEGRGYRVRDVELGPFIMSGGGAYCMTLRLDRQSKQDVLF